jgi:hypothetical protein
VQKTRKEFKWIKNMKGKGPRGGRSQNVTENALPKDEGMIRSENTKSLVENNTGGN